MPFRFRTHDLSNALVFSGKMDDLTVYPVDQTKLKMAMFTV